MARTVVGIIVGYLTMFVLVSITFMGVFLLMGTEWSFKPGSFEASNGWVAMALVSNFIIGVVGGLICVLIARGEKAPLVLAIVVFVLGLVLAIPAVIARNTYGGLARTGNVTQAEAMQKANEPIWAPFTFPVLGAVGVLLGGKLKRR
jgi:hypothetical protein